MLDCAKATARGPGRRYHGAMLEALFVIASPLAVIAAISMTAAHRERQRRALRCCPVCHGRAIVRALARPPRHEPRYRRVALAFRCTGCGVELFELVRVRSVGPLTAEQLDSWIAASDLPVATLRRG